MIGGVCFLFLPGKNESPRFSLYTTWTTLEQTFLTFFGLNIFFLCWAPLSRSHGRPSVVTWSGCRTETLPCSFSFCEFLQSRTQFISLLLVTITCPSSSTPPHYTHYYYTQYSFSHPNWGWLVQISSSTPPPPPPPRRLLFLQWKWRWCIIRGRQ